jgi:hypothetical protein
VLEASKFIMEGERRWNEAREFSLKDKIKIRRSRYVEINSHEFNRKSQLFSKEIRKKVSIFSN